MHPGLPHEAVRQSRILLGCVSQPRHKMLLDAHSRSFGALGGVPRRGIYDNMKTAVDKVNKGKGCTVNARFAVMCAHYLFDSGFCNVAVLPGYINSSLKNARKA